MSKTDSARSYRTYIHPLHVTPPLLHILCLLLISMKSDAEYSIKDLLNTYSNHEQSVEDQCTDNYLNVEAILSTPWQACVLNSDGINDNHSLGHCSIQQREDISMTGNLLQRTHAVLNYMYTLSIDLPTLLYSISGAAGNEFVKDARIRGEHGFLVDHPDFPLTLTALDKHCGCHSCTEQAKNPLQWFAVDNVQQNMNREMIALKPLIKMNIQEILIDLILGSHWQQTLEAANYRHHLNIQN
jgi:hypothetical protein